MRQRASASPCSAALSKREIVRPTPWRDQSPTKTSGIGCSCCARAAGGAAISTIAKVRAAPRVETDTRWRTAPATITLHAPRRIDGGGVVTAQAHAHYRGGAATTFEAAGLT